MKAVTRRAKLEFDSGCKLMIANSDEFISIKTIVFIYLSIDYPQFYYVYDNFYVYVCVLSGFSMRIVVAL